ncbi:MAG: hypothetical protein ACPLQP_05955 [Moorellaceae bacterium]
MFDEKELERYLKQGGKRGYNGVVYYPETLAITFEGYLKNWLEPFMRTCAKSGISTFEAMLILEAHKRNLARVSRVEAPPDEN